MTLKKVKEIRPQMAKEDHRILCAAMNVRAADKTWIRLSKKRLGKRRLGKKRLGKIG